MVSCSVLQSQLVFLANLLLGLDVIVENKVFNISVSICHEDVNDHTNRTVSRGIPHHVSHPQ